MRITNNEASYARNRRLFQVACLYYELMEAKGYGQEAGGKYEWDGPFPLSSTRIKRIHDHKGLLTVVWESQPGETEVECIELAWERAGEEPRCNVTHEIGGDDVL